MPTEIGKIQVLRIVAFCNLYLDAPNAELRRECRSLLEDLESRLLTDLTCSGLNLLEKEPTCN